MQIRSDGFLKSHNKIFFFPQTKYLLPSPEGWCIFLFKYAQLDLAHAVLPKCCPSSWCRDEADDHPDIYKLRQCKFKKIIQLNIYSVNKFKEPEHNSTQLLNERPDPTSLLTSLSITDPVTRPSFRRETSISWPDRSEGSRRLSLICSAETWSSRHFGDVWTFLCSNFATAAITLVSNSK